MKSANFFLRPAPKEQVEVTAILREDPRPALLGCAVDEHGKPLRDALAVLYASGGTEPDRMVGAVYTDEWGRFSFGPLEPQTLYLIQISQLSSGTRALELNPG